MFIDKDKITSQDVSAKTLIGPMRLLPPPQAFST